MENNEDQKKLNSYLKNHPDMKNEYQEMKKLAAEAKKAWKKHGFPVDLAQYFRLQAKIFEERQKRLQDD